MTTYLIDYENTSHHGFEGFKALSPEDNVIVFLGAKNESSTIPIDTVLELASIDPRPMLLWKRSKKTSKNYLDMQLVSYLGCLIGDPNVDESSYVIVSNDHDFLAAVDFWAEHKQELDISVRATIAPKVAAKAATPNENPAPSEALKKAVRAAVKDLNLKPSDYTAIYRVFGTATSRQEFHKLLNKGLSGKGPQAYAVLKDIYTSSYVAPTTS